MADEHSTIPSSSSSHQHHTADPAYQSGARGDGGDEYISPVQQEGLRLANAQPSPNHQDRAGPAHDHTSATPQEPAAPGNGHTTTSSTRPASHPHSYIPPHIRAIPTLPPSYPTGPLTNPFTAPSDVILGFAPPSQVVAERADAADDAVPATSGATQRWHSDLYCAIHAPLAPGENLFDPNMEQRRREAILGGWVDAKGKRTPEADFVYEESEEEGREGGEGKAKKKKSKRGKRGGKKMTGKGGRGGLGGEGTARGGFGGDGGMGGAGATVVI